MINPFLLRPRERMSDWKSFRKSLLLMSEDQQLAEVARYWAQAPLFNRAYSIDQPSTWMTPWEMMSANRWCRHTTAIGMEFTLRLAGWDPNRMALKLLVDFDHHGTFFALEIDNQHWLNHEYRKVIPIGGCYDELFGWRYEEGRYMSVPRRTKCLAA